MSLMAAPATPHTPASQAPRTPTPAPAPAPQLHTPNGTWRHPKFDEIARRQYATTFDDTNVRAIAANAALLAASFFAHALPATLAALVRRTPYSHWAILALRLFLALNILNALLPLARRYYPDDLADIPLTPSQRSAMGLQPASAPSAYASPASAYVTPPRYSRSTPRSSFSSHGDRPLLASATTAYSPGLPTSASKRSTYAPASPFNSTLFADSASSNGPPTPTPATGKASVGLNNKWLYEKRRDSPRSGMFA